MQGSARECKTGAAGWGKENPQDLRVLAQQGKKKKRGLSVSLFGVGGGVRTHDLQIHNLAL